MIRVIFLLGGGLGILLVAVFGNIAAANPKYGSHWILPYNQMLTEPALLNERGQQYRRYMLYALWFLPLWMLAGKLLIWLVEGTWDS